MGGAYTRTGKKLEVPIKRIIAGVPIADAANLAAVDRADLVEWYAAFAQQRGLTRSVFPTGRGGAGRSGQRRSTAVTHSGEARHAAAAVGRCG